MDGSVLEKNSCFKMLRLTFYSKLDWGLYIISIAKTDCKKIGALIRSMKFLSPGAALYLHKFTIRLCMEYCCHVWAGALSCYLELLDSLQKQIQGVHQIFPKNLMIPMALPSIFHMISYDSKEFPTTRNL